MSGNTCGRVIGIVAGSLGALGALLSVGGATPWWSLASSTERDLGREASGYGTEGLRFES